MQHKYTRLPHKPLIYVAHPFRARTILGINANIKKAKKYAKHLYTVGYTPIVPHANSTFLFGKINDTPEEDRKVSEYDLRLLAECEYIAVCGDRISKGMQREIDFAKEHDIKTIYVPLQM